MRLVLPLLSILRFAILPVVVAPLCAWVRGVSDMTDVALFTASIILSAYFGGMSSGLLATAVATFLFYCGSGHEDLAGTLVLFPLLGLMASCIGHERHLQWFLTRTRPTFLAGGSGPIVVADLQGRVCFLNHVAVELLARPEVETIGQPLGEVVHLTDEAQRQPIAAASAGGRTALLRTVQGDELAVEVTVEPATDESGTAQGTLFSFLDLTRQRRLECQLLNHTLVAEELRRQLHQAEEQTQSQAAEGNALRAKLTEIQQASDRLLAAQAKSAETEQQLRSEIKSLEREKKQLQRQASVHAEAADATQRDHAEKEASWHQTEEHLREEIATLSMNVREHQHRLEMLQLDMDDARNQGAEREAAWQRTEEQLRRDLAEKEAAWLRIEVPLRRELGEMEAAWRQAEEKLTRASVEHETAWHLAEEQLRRESAEREATWRRTEEQLRGESAEKAAAWRQTEEQLRGELSALERSGRHAEEQLRREVESLTEANHRLESKIDELTRTADELLRDHDEQARSWKQTEEQLRQKIATLELDAATFRSQVTELIEAAETQRQDFAERERIWQQTEEEFRADAAERAAALQQAVEQRQRLERELTMAMRRPADLIDRLIETARPLVASFREAAAFTSSEAASDQLRRLTRVLDGASVASRLGAGNLSLNRQPVEVSALLERAVAATMALVKERDHHLTVELPLQPEQVSADADRLTLALEHLVDNAARYTPPGGTLHLTAERTGEMVEFRVRDSGIGIPPRELPELQRLSARDGYFRSGDGDGMGIGVALARSLIELHGGSLTVESKNAGEGSEVVLRLPVLTEKQPVAALPYFEERDALAEVG